MKVAMEVELGGAEFWPVTSVPLNLLLKQYLDRLRRQSSIVDYTNRWEVQTGIQTDGWGKEFFLLKKFA